MSDPTYMRVVEHTLCGALVLRHGDTTTITTLPSFVGAALRSEMKYGGAPIHLLDERGASDVKKA